MTRMIALVLTFAACTSRAPESDPVRAVPTPYTSMPAIEFAHRAEVFARVVQTRLQNIAVDTTGRIALFPAEFGAPVIRFIDSTGRWTGGASRIGTMPGEFSTSTRLWFVGDTLLGDEPSRGVEIRFNRDGSYRSERPITAGRISVAAAAEGVLEFNHDWKIRQIAPQLWLRPWRGGEARLLGGALPGHLALAVADDSGATTPSWPVVAMQSGVIALVEPRAPTVWYFNLAGELLDSIAIPEADRTLGPYEGVEEAEERARLGSPSSGSVPGVGLPARPPVAFIHGAQFDGKGRLWVVGPHHDSTRALLLAGRKSIGTHMLPCFRVGRFVALNGRWLALHCSKGNRADPPFELQLYRIVEPAPLN